MTITPAAVGALARGDLENFLVASQPGGIEAQEARGQRDLVETFNRLPHMKEREMDAAVKMGFIIGDRIDEVFVAATPPKGWTLRATEHSMHSDIIDDNGRVRGGLFYKAAFYDRKARVSWNRRYTVDIDYRDGFEIYIARDNKTNEPIMDPVEVTDPKSPEDGNWDAYDAARAENAKVYAAMVARLDERFPDNNDASAYWND
jgi:hypothetical protein